MSRCRFAISAFKLRVYDRSFPSLAEKRGESSAGFRILIRTDEMKFDPRSRAFRCSTETSTGQESPSLRASSANFQPYLGSLRPTPWSPHLSEAIEQAGHAFDKELLADTLLANLEKSADLAFIRVCR